MASSLENHSAGLLLLAGVGVSSVSHPIALVKTLIQVGHEPLAPRVGKSIFDRSILTLPGFWDYSNFIVEEDGFLGLFRGFVPRICCQVTANCVYNFVQDKLTEGETLVKEENVKTTVQKTGKQSLARCAAILISQPFHVITVRCMAQFVGKETIYSGFFSPLKHIWQEDGIRGFFVGLVPRLLSEVLALWLANFMVYLARNYLISQEISRRAEVRNYSQACGGLIAGMVTYPFSLVANVITVNNCGLQAGMPPNMELYNGWRDCWSQLSLQGNLKRGSSILMARKYTPPSQL